MSIEFLIFFLITFLWIISARQAFFQLTRGRIRKLENENAILAKKMEKWLEHKPAYQIVYRILLFFNIAIIASLCFNIFNNFVFYKHFSNSQVSSVFLNVIPHVIVAAIITVFLVILAEAVTRIFVIKYDIQILKITMPLIRLLHCTFLYPFVIFINFINKKVQSSQNIEEDDIITTEDEILSLLENDSFSDLDDNSLEEDERQMIKGIFELDNTTVTEIMTPRVDVIAIPSTSSLDAAVKLFIESGHSRIPVYLKTIDEITGIILAKDFLNTDNIIDKNLSQLSHKPCLYLRQSKSANY